MLGSLNHTSKKVTIVGAGVSGLLLAHYLDRAGCEVTLLEAADRAGGLIRTHRTPFGLSEGAAHSVLATSAVRELFSELNVPLHALRRNSRGRYIFRDGRMRKLPLKFRELLGLFLRAYFILADRKIEPDRLTLTQWASRHLGAAALRYLLTPFVRGIYGADPDNISIGAAFPQLVIPRGHSLLSFFLARLLHRPSHSAHPSKPGQKKKAMSAPEGGMGSLVSALETSLEKRLGSRFAKGHRIDSLPASDNLALCVPAYEAARLLKSHDPALSEKLVAITYTPMVSITVFLPAQDGAHLVRGVGVLNPPGEGRRSLGILFNSSSFPGRVPHETSSASFTLMLGGSAEPGVLHASDSELSEITRNEIRGIFGFSSAPTHLVIHRWEKAIPQYNNHLLDTWQTARAGWCAQPGRILFGNYTAQVSLRGMIEQAAALATGLHK